MGKTDVQSNQTEGKTVKKNTNTKNKMSPPLSLPKSKTQPGIILKQYESVLSQILSSNIPDFVPPSLPFPPPSSSDFLCKEINPSIEHSSVLKIDVNTINEALQLTCASNVLPSQSYKRRGARPLPRDRALAKQSQLRSMIQCVIPMIPEPSTPLVEDFNNHAYSQNNKIRIVDFAGGSGHLALPLSLLFPQCEIVLVDLKKASLDLARERAAAIVASLPNYIENVSSGDNTDTSTITTSPSPELRSTLERIIESSSSTVTHVETTHTPTNDSPTLEQAAIPNLFTFLGDITSYDQPFHIGLALHACGEATDLTLRKCGEKKANFVTCPCCIGKLSRKVKNPYIYQATNENTPTVNYPQSSHFQNILKSIDWDILAKAADYGEGHSSSKMNLQENDQSLMRANIKQCNHRKVAKTLVEVDRLLYMKDKFGYQVALTKMEPGVKTPKNDILLGWHDSLTTNTDNGATTVKKPYYQVNGKNGDKSKQWDKDFEIAMHYLGKGHVGKIEDEDVTCDNSNTAKDYVHMNSILGGEWMEQEINEINSIIEAFVNNDEEKVLKFPKGQTSRIRKLVHNIAETKKLRHWSEGKRNSERIIIVAKRLNKKEEVNVK